MIRSELEQSVLDILSEDLDRDYYSQINNLRALYSTLTLTESEYYLDFVLDIVAEERNGWWSILQHALEVMNKTGRLKNPLTLSHYSCSVHSARYQSSKISI